jgi:hypothetical protein
MAAGRQPLEDSMFLRIAFSAATIALAAGPSVAAPAIAPSTRDCIYERDIRDQNIPDDRTIVFHMRDGTTYVNHLASACPGLHIHNGFAYDGTPNSELCSNDGSIRVVETGTHCLLGTFELVPNGHTQTP